jgi:hypothetical protein
MVKNKIVLVRGETNLMEPQQEPFDTFTRWMVTRLRRDMAADPQASSSPLYRFFTFIYDDMLANPEAYNIPHEPFVTFIARVNLTPKEITQHEVLKASRMRVRKVVFAYLEFLYSLGQVSLPNEEGIQLPSATFEILVADGIKKAKTRHFLIPLERSGFSFLQGDPVLVSNSIFPGMLAALIDFNLNCARVKDFGFHLFRRCDLAVLDGKSAPDLTDALQLTPQPFQSDTAETDVRLRQLRFKREIFVDADMSYRLRYSKKGNQIVYWCRIQEAFHADLHHYLRWKLESNLTPRLFSRLEEIKPGLADCVFEGLKSCAHCYGENCLARAKVAWDGKVKDACNEYGWNNIGYTRRDYENLWTVVGALIELAA